MKQVDHFIAMARHRSHKKLRAEFEGLNKLPKVSSVRCDKNGLTIRTETLYIRHSMLGTLHRIGRIKINILPQALSWRELLDSYSSPSRHLIKFRNLDHTVRGIEGYRMQHPHIWRGRACFGSMRLVVEQLLLKREYSALVQLLLVFLQTANVADYAGANLRKWPRAEVAA